MSETHLMGAIRWVREELSEDVENLEEMKPKFAQALGQAKAMRQDVQAFIADLKDKNLDAALAELKRMIDNLINVMAFLGYRKEAQRIRKAIHTIVKEDVDDAEENVELGEDLIPGFKQQTSRLGKGDVLITSKGSKSFMVRKTKAGDIELWDGDNWIKHEAGAKPLFYSQAMGIRVMKKALLAQFKPVEEDTSPFDQHSQELSEAETVDYEMLSDDRKKLVTKVLRQLKKGEVSSVHHGIHGDIVILDVPMHGEVRMNKALLTLLAKSSLVRWISGGKNELSIGM